MQTGDYILKPSTELTDFLQANKFKHRAMFDDNPLECEYVLVVNAIDRTYACIDKFYIAKSITLKEFYDEINYLKQSKYEKLYNDDGLLYEGYTINGKPYGLGVLFFDNGEIYREGVFDFKGIRMGREHHYNGRVKFEGTWTINHGYGPNAPRIGNVYDEDGKLVFSGKFVIKKGGVGWPMIKYPRCYRNIEKKSPKIDYVRDEDFKEVGIKDYWKRHSRD